MQLPKKPDDTEPVTKAVLPTSVSIINDSSSRFKIKINNDRDQKFDKIINIEPGGRLDGIKGSVPGPGRFDVIVDIIINPAGPDNNIRLGGFKFDNPAFDFPYVKSDEFTTLGIDSRDYIGIDDDFEYKLERKRYRSESDPKRYWGKLDSSLLDKTPYYDEQNALLINSAPKPTFTIEPFFDDSGAGAKVWDLRINSDNFTL